MRRLKNMTQSVSELKLRPSSSEVFMVVVKTPLDVSSMYPDMLLNNGMVYSIVDFQSLSTIWITTSPYGRLMDFLRHLSDEGNTVVLIERLLTFLSNLRHRMLRLTD